MCQRMWTCRHVLICADMSQHVASLSASLMQNIWTLSACWYVSAHMDMPTCAAMSRHVLICTDMCRHVLIWADMCRYVPTYSITLGTSDTNHLDLTWMLACVSTFGHSDMCWYVPTCADMCRHVPKCTITLGISDTNPLDLLCMLACVSTCGHADMC